MALALPNLDTRTWEDLVAEGMALLPRHAPGWTDHNAHDPGVTLVELLAFLVEQELYRANRITERHRRAFLALVGHPPRPPIPARAEVALTPAAGPAPVSLPAGVELEAVAHGHQPLTFLTLDPVTLVAARVAAVQIDNEAGARDVSPRLAAGRSAPLGARAGDCLMIGVDAPVPAGTELSLWLTIAGDGDEGDGADPTHHDLVTRWETFDGSAWRAADAGDGTRSLTRAGALRLVPAVDVPLARAGAVDRPLAHLRCRIISGRPDEAAAIAAAEINVVSAEQRRPARSRLPIRPGTVPTPRAPVPGESVPLTLELDAEGALTGLGVDTDPGAPAIAVLDYHAATPVRPGEIVVGAVPVLRGTGMTGQAAVLPGAPLADEPVLWSAESGGARAWRVAVDRTSGAIEFGDGRWDRVPPPGAWILAAYSTTAAERGNLASADWSAPGAGPRVAEARSLRGAAGGRAAEEVAAAVRRAAEELWAHERLVELAPEVDGTLDGQDDGRVLARVAPARATTLRDVERIARGIPGTCVRRARAWEGLEVEDPCLHVPGRIVCVILPGLPAERPEPSPGLQAAVRAVLAERRIIGTRIEVVGPTYVDMDVRARLALLAGYDPARVRDEAASAIRRLLHPLQGGPGGCGWPFGRDVHRAELLALLDGIDGVDRVEGLDLSRPGGEPPCAGVCLAPMELPLAGAIEVGTAP